MKTTKIPLFLCLLVILSSADFVYADLAEQLILRYYRDKDSSLISGHARLLKHVYNPTLDKKQFMPPENKLEGLDENEKTKKLNQYFKYLSESYNVNFEPGTAEHKYSAIEVYYEEDNKRKNLANLGEAAYQSVLNKKDGFNDLAFERYFDNGSKMTSINDQDGLNKLDPQVVITPDNLGIPPINRFGKPRLTPEFCSIMEERVKTGFYSVSGQETEDGFLVVAESNRSKLKKIELLFRKEEDNYVVSHVRQYNHFNNIIDEEQYGNYIMTSSKTLLPTKVLFCTFMPIPVVAKDGTIQQLVSYQEEFTVLDADFNIDIPDEIFVPDLPYGATVYDTTVSPPLQYFAYKLENANKEDFFESDALEVLNDDYILPNTSLQELNKQKPEVLPEKNKVASPIETRKTTTNSHSHAVLLLLVVILVLLLVLGIYKKITPNHNEKV